MEAETEVSASLAPLRDRKSVVRSMIERVGTHNLSLLIALAALVAIFGGLRPDIFFLVRNILNIGQAIAISSGSVVMPDPTNLFTIIQRR